MAIHQNSRNGFISGVEVVILQISHGVIMQIMPTWSINGYQLRKKKKEEKKEERK